ncbi:hypothetical protein EH240_08460 [Mesorhizobium tamadayense]|uniref:Uncharacterized protein n=1 Tax=Mesorhizobium tamadayense TaxID=425306 RepID=A0A3P3G0U0_9HYPH|nr:hypothetical protein EH240_08460 [Mesorhizobium tamadayense]
MPGRSRPVWHYPVCRRLVCRRNRFSRRWSRSETPAGQHPPLSCRTSPPQGGRSDVTPAFANHTSLK